MAARAQNTTRSAAYAARLPGPVQKAVSQTGPLRRTTDAAQSALRTPDFSGQLLINGTIAEIGAD